MMDVLKVIGGVLFWMAYVIIMCWFLVKAI